MMLNVQVKPLPIMESIAQSDPPAADLSNELVEVRSRCCYERFVREVIMCGQHAHVAITDGLAVALETSGIPVVSRKLV